MPIMPLTGEFENDFYVVVSCMGFPTDEVLRERFLYSMKFVDDCAEGGADDNNILSAYPLAFFRDAIKNPKDIFNIYEKSMRKLYKSSMILHVLLKMFTEKNNEPSINKAIYYLSEIKDDSGKTYFSNSTLRKLWGQYKSVAHLNVPGIITDSCGFWLTPWTIKGINKADFYNSLSLSGKVYNYLLTQKGRNPANIYSGEEWIVPENFIVGDDRELVLWTPQAHQFDEIIKEYAVDRPIFLKN